MYINIKREILGFKNIFCFISLGRSSIELKKINSDIERKKQLKLGQNFNSLSHSDFLWQITMSSL